MNFLAAENLNNLLTKLAQANSGAGQVRVGSDHAENVSLRLRRVPAEQEIRRTQVEETQRVALDDLAEIHQPSQLVGSGRDVDGHDGVASLGRSKQVAHRADAANARCDAGHFGVGPALAEFLEAAKLDDMKLGVGHIAGVVHEDADLGVAFDAGYGVNDDAFWHTQILRARERRLSTEFDLRPFQFWFRAAQYLV